MNFSGPVYRASGLSFAFSPGSPALLSNLDFEVRAGEMVAVIGPNGAGKSTLLNILLGFQQGYSGSVEFLGRELSGISPSDMARRRAYIPQENEPPLRLSVSDLMELSSGTGPAADRRAIEKLFDELSISRLFERQMSELSGGESRLVQLAFALSRDPEVLLLDEPVSSLDVANQKIFFDRLAGAVKARRSAPDARKLTVVAVLHDLNLAAYYSDRIMLVGGGGILKFAAPLEVLNAGTLGSIFFRGDGRSQAAAGGSTVPAVAGAPAFRNFQSGVRPSRRAHVICGGGSGIDVISALSRAGYEVSAGVVNIGDSDWDLCRTNSIEVVEEEPFRAISQSSAARNAACIEKSDIVVVCAFPLGLGNLSNLEFIENERLIKGKKIFSEFGDGSGRDFTSGGAAPLIKKLAELAAPFKGPDELRKLADTAAAFPDGGFGA